jgi:hypothetical protein
VGERRQPLRQHHHPPTELRAAKPFFFPFTASNPKTFVPIPAFTEAMFVPNTEHLLKKVCPQPYVLTITFPVLVPDKQHKFDW